jgi:hypothetical protein
MAPEEAQQNAPRRRGRPPGSKNIATRRKRGDAGDLVGQLNAMVAELITKNRNLQRQVAKLSDRARASAASKGVERGLRTISRRVQKALSGAPKRRTRKVAAPTNGRRRKVATRRRRAS